ncbi:MAG: ComEA family DNA-binding protein [Gloeobacterales cyanobacterium]
MKHSIWLRFVAVSLLFVSLTLPAQAQFIKVSVSGAVNKPGKYTLPTGSRTIDAIQAAGGTRSDAQTAGLDLVAPLKGDGYLTVPSKKEAPSQASRAVQSSTAVAPTKAIDLNQATAEELAKLPKIGPSTAEKIVQDRQLKGPYQSLADLDRVSGIGRGTLVKLSGIVTINGTVATYEDKKGSAQTKAQLNINQATYDELEALRGVSPKLAGQILQLRLDHRGRLTRLEDLKEIPGMTDAKLKSLARDLKVE